MRNWREGVQKKGDLCTKSETEAQDKKEKKKKHSSTHEGNLKRKAGKLNNWGRKSNEFRGCFQTIR